jgi:hypothetical protein
MHGKWWIKISRPRVSRTKLVKINRQINVKTATFPERFPLLQRSNGRSIAGHKSKAETESDVKLTGLAPAIGLLTVSFSRKGSYVH